MALDHKSTRTLLWGAVLALAFIASGLYGYTTLTRSGSTGIGTGSYVLETAEGEVFSRDSLKGQPTMLFFGYTHCPDVCPTTMAELVGWYETLGEAAKDLRAYFVTVDPERDSADVIREYVSWTGHVQGVTGSRAETDKAIAAWRVFAEKVPGRDGHYTMNHTASVFLVDATGNFAGTISYEEDATTAVAKIRKLLAG